MKKSILIFFSLIFSLTLLVSCATSVRVSYMVPSKVNMGPYRNIAIASTVPYQGKITYPQYIPFQGGWGFGLNFIFPYSIRSSYNSELPYTVASFATDGIYQTLSNTSFFKSILPPGQTDSILSLPSYSQMGTSQTFKARGVDAVIIPKIENMKIDEFIFAKKKKDDKPPPKPNGSNPALPPPPQGPSQYVYYMHRSAEILISVSIIDTSTNQIISRLSYTASRSWEDTFNPERPYDIGEIYTLRYFFKSMVDEIDQKILSDLVPAKVTRAIDLMSNSDPKDERLEEYYKAAEKGSLRYALDGFLASWNSKGLLQAGYNAALLYASLGEFENAISLASDVYRKTGNRKASELESNLSTYLKQTKAAEVQLSGLGLNDSYQNTNYTAPQQTIYDWVRNN